MSTSVSRRRFIRSSAAGASVVALGSAGVSRSYAASEKVRLGWLGVGGRGSHDLTMMANNCPDARIVAVCELIEKRGRKGQKIVVDAGQPKPKYYESMHEMMDKEKLDGIAAVTAPSDHAGVVVPILSRDFNCFSEKPMDTAVERVDAIVTAARGSKGFYQIGTQRRYNPGYVSGMKAIHDGEIGDVTFTQGHWHWPWKPQMNIERQGGELVEQAVHHTDIAAWAQRDVAPVSCAAMAYSHVDRPGGPNKWTETQSAVSWFFPNGAVFSYTHLFYLPEFYTSEQMVVHGKKGTVDLRLGRLHTIDKKTRRLGPSSGRDWDKGTKEEMQAFVAKVKDGSKSLPTANVESGRVNTLMAIMGRMAMRNPGKNKLEPQLIKWKDLGTTTDRQSVT